MTNNNPIDIDITDTKGDIIGVGVDGSGNIIGKNISIVVNEVQNRYGLRLLSTNYFKEHKSIERDFENWKKGFSFNLESIKEGKEFRREVVETIESRLETNQPHHMLLVGESGTSKSTILMEIMCDYFDKGYKILYNFGETKITNGSELVNYIEDLLKGNNQIFIAVDNAHDERTAAIFYVIDKLSNYELQDNIRFLLTARLPEYEWFVKDRLGKIQEDEYSESIRKFRDNSTIFKYELPFFSKDEIKGFIKRYGSDGGDGEARRTKFTEDLIYNDTKGHPIMVKFYVLGDGLRKDVERRYSHYLYDRDNDHPDTNKIQTMLVCSLLDIANLPITDKLLEAVGLLEYACDLHRATLYQYSESWKTIHPRWDAELLSFLYNESNKSIISKRKEYLKKTIDYIFNIRDDTITASVIQAIYDLASVKSIPINIVESIIIQLPDHLSKETKRSLYVLAMAAAYRRLGKFNDILDKCNKALEIDPKYGNAWNNKGWAIAVLGNDKEAIECYDKALEINPKNGDAWNNKGWSLSNLKKYEEAKECCKKAIEIGFGYAAAWNNKGRTEQLTGNAYYNLEEYQEAIECYDKALEIDPKYGDAWNNKGLSLDGLKKYEEAIECYDKALEINPKNGDAWNNKGWSLSNLKKYEEAIECYDKALEIDPKKGYTHSLYNRACSKVKKGDIDGGLEDLRKAIENNKEYIKSAKEGQDFESIRNDDRFKALISDHMQNK
jgi:tetratricopeptide (TPR) repeat protein